MAGLSPSSSGPVYGVTDPVERARLRAELDGMIAHLYGLSHDEFAHILASFPLVAESVKAAALCAYDMPAYPNSLALPEAAHSASL